MTPYFADLCFIESRGKEDFLDMEYVPGIDLGNTLTGIARGILLLCTRSPPIWPAT